MRILWVLFKLAATLAALTAVAGVAFFLAIQHATTKQSVAVPDLVGLDEAEAARRLAERRLVLQVASGDPTAYDERVPAGHVLGQDPPAGSSIKQERRVRVRLSLGPGQVWVPRVVGEGVTAANVKLQQAGLRVGRLAYAPAAAVADGIVLDQEPRSLARGADAAVSLLVSTGPERAVHVMPDLVGQPVLRVRAALELKGYRVSVQSEPHDGIPEGTILRHKPPAGHPLRAGDAVWLWLASGAAGRGGGQP